MGVNLPRDITLAGFRMPQVKQALKAYARTGQAENFLEVESFAPSRMEAAALYEELLERKFIDPNSESHEHFLTEAGLAIAGGKTRRSPLSTARRVLDDTLTRIEDMNENSAPLNVVERVWLFGSVMRGLETVGDIDLAIETAHNPAFGSDAARSARLRELVDQAPDHLLYFRKLGWHEEHGIFGERRHPLLAGAHIGSDELKQMGVPCQLIFDRSRGGRVADGVIPRHPDSSGRSNEMNPPRELPDLAPIEAVPAPMDARWMSAYGSDGRVSPHRLLSERTHVPGSGSFVMTDHTELHWHDWCPSSLRAGGFDGVSKVVLKFHETWSDPTGREAAAMVLRREIRALETEIELRIEVSDFQRPRRLKPRLDRPFLELCGMVAMIMCGDIHRQSVRLNERQVNLRIAIDLDATGLPDELQSAAPAWIRSLLEEFAPRMGASEEEPIGNEEA